MRPRGLVPSNGEKQEHGKIVFRFTARFKNRIKQGMPGSALTMVEAIVTNPFLADRISEKKGWEGI